MISRRHIRPRALRHAPAATPVAATAALYLPQDCPSAPGGNCYVSFATFNLKWDSQIQVGGWGGLRGRRGWAEVWRRTERPGAAFCGCCQPDPLRSPLPQPASVARADLSRHTGRSLLQGLLEIGRTTFTILILLLGAVVFIRDTHRLVLRPLERMVALVSGGGGVVCVCVCGGGGGTAIARLPVDRSWVVA